MTTQEHLDELHRLRRYDNTDISLATIDHAIACIQSVADAEAILKAHGVKYLNIEDNGELGFAVIVKREDDYVTVPDASLPAALAAARRKIEG
jgi:hypothetical protein